MFKDPGEDVFRKGKQTTGKAACSLSESEEGRSDDGILMIKYEGRNCDPALI